MGVSLCLAALNVFFEDTEHLTGVVIQAMYFLCPILYPMTMLPPEVVTILEFNPMFSMTIIFKDIFYNNQIPEMHNIIYTLVSSVLVLIAGLVIFNKADKRMIYFT